MPAAPDDGHRDGDQRGPLTVADAPRSRSATLTIPQTNANGTITNTTRVITDIAGAR